jgi:hypothetical protein
MYWVINFCKIKLLTEIRTAAEAVLEEFLDGKILQEFLVATVKMCRRGILGFKSKGEGVFEWIELIAECCNKLIYLSCESAVAKTVSSNRAGDRNNKSEELGEGELPNSASTGPNNGCFDEVNFEFEVQEASIHIGRINMLLLPFARLLSETVNCYLRDKGEDEGDWSTSFMLRNWRDVNRDKWSTILWEHDCGIRNPGRMIICLNNLIGFAHNIGHEYNAQPMNRGCNFGEVNDENSGAEINILNILCSFKLMLIHKTHGLWTCYHAYAEMVFMGHLPKSQEKL